MMNAKELRKAALHTADDLVTDKRLDGYKIMPMCQYILATVRDDDDEAYDPEWALSVACGAEVDLGNGFYLDTQDLSICIDVELTIRSYTDRTAIRCKTRGQFRALLAGLGLKEGE